MKLSLFYLFRKTFHSPPLKSLSCCKMGSRVLDSCYYVEKYQRKRVACYCYQKLRLTNFFKKNFGECSQIGCFKVKNSTWKNLTLRQLHKFFDCIRTPLKGFSPCLKFHSMEIRLRHLHKRTNPGFTPELWNHSFRTLKSESSYFLKENARYFLDTLFYRFFT